jgi:hypothetical protein
MLNFINSLSAETLCMKKDGLYKFLFKKNDKLQF